MSVASRIQEIERHIGDIYDTLELGGDSTQNKNIVNINSEIKREYKDFLANGTDTLWNNWNKVSGTGESLTLNNTIKGKMKIEYGGNTSQEGTPTPDSPQDIHVVSGDNSIKVEGKNLFDKNNSGIVNGRRMGLNGISIPDIDYFVTNYIRIKSNTNYVVNYEMSVYSRMAFYDKNKVFISDNSSNANFITPSEAYYVILGNLQSNKDTIQLEEGSTATTYEPYQSTTYPINLGSMELCKIGDYQDSIVKDNSKWYLNKQIGKVVLDGSENWNGLTKLDNETTSWFQMSALDDARSVLATNNNTLFSSYFNIYNCYGASNTNPGLCYHRDKRIQVRFPKDLLSDTSILSKRIESFKTWLSNHNVDVLYQLATPTYTEITDSTLINQLEAIKLSYNEQTNISQTNTDKPFILDVTALGELEI